MPLALADELFLMLRDLQTGRAKVAEPGLGVALAAALLAELGFAGSIGIRAGAVTLGDAPPPAELLAEALYEETRNRLYGGPVPVRAWLAAHRQLAQELVADRLIRGGELRRQTSRWLGRTVRRYLPVRPSPTFLRAQRLPAYLRHQVEVGEEDVVLGALLRLATRGRLGAELDPAAVAYLDQLTPGLPAWTRTLLEATESALAGGRGRRISR